jgi:RNA polymerase sigma factor (TIGR02999 family)
MRSDELAVVQQAISSGDRAAIDRLFTTLHAELRRVARGQRMRWEGNDTLNTTALVNEAYIKLLKANGRGWADRAHFFAVASRAMRQILVNYAESRRAARRGGGAPHVPLHDMNPVSDEGADDLIALHDALGRLARVSERQARVVECRFFAGLSIRETAEALGTSPATVERDWALASAWLRRELSDPADEQP